jgi:hypothetical protein
MCQGNSFHTPLWQDVRTPLSTGLEVLVHACRGTGDCFTRNTTFSQTSYAYDPENGL